MVEDDENKDTSPCFPLGVIALCTNCLHQFGDKARKTRLKWAGRVQRRENEHSSKRTVKDHPGRSKRGRHMMKVLYALKEEVRTMNETGKESLTSKYNVKPSDLE